MRHEECIFETKFSPDILAYQNCVISKWKNGTKLHTTTIT
jgi:hypothetical protein